MIRIESLTPRKNVVKYQTHSFVEPQPQVVKPTYTNKILTEPTYTVGDENLLIIKSVDESEVTLNSQNERITIKSLTTVLIKPDTGQIDEEWDELLLEKGACVQFQFVEGNWYILNSDGLKLA
jgi:hypothetical protein